MVASCKKWTFYAIHGEKYMKKNLSGVGKFLINRVFKALVGGQLLEVVNVTGACRLDGDILQYHAGGIAIQTGILDDGREIPGAGVHVHMTTDTRHSAGGSVLVHIPLQGLVIARAIVRKPDGVFLGQPRMAFLRAVRSAMAFRVASWELLNS